MPLEAPVAPPLTSSGGATIEFRDDAQPYIWVWHGDKEECDRVFRHVVAQLKGRILTKQTREAIVGQLRSQMPRWLIKAKNIRKQNLCKKHPRPHVLVHVPGSALNCDTCRLGEVAEDF